MILLHRSLEAHDSFVRVQYTIASAQLTNVWFNWIVWQSQRKSTTAISVKRKWKYWSQCRCTLHSPFAKNWTVFRIVDAVFASHSFIRASLEQFFYTLASFSLWLNSRRRVCGMAAWTTFFSSEFHLFNFNRRVSNLHANITYGPMPVGIESGPQKSVKNILPMQ